MSVENMENFALGVILEAPLILFGVFEVSAEFPNLKNLLNTSRARKCVVMTDNNPILTDNWEYI